MFVLVEAWKSPCRGNEEPNVAPEPLVADPCPSGFSGTPQSVSDWKWQIMEQTGQAEQYMLQLKYEAISSNTIYK